LFIFMTSKGLNLDLALVKTSQRLVGVDGHFYFSEVPVYLLGFKVMGEYMIAFDVRRLWAFHFGC